MQYECNLVDCKEFLRTTSAHLAKNIDRGLLVLAYSIGEKLFAYGSYLLTTEEAIEKRKQGARVAR